MLVFNDLLNGKELNMLAPATEEKIPYQPLICNLFLPLPETDFRDFLTEVDEFIRFAPEIITAIEEDLDVHARNKKKLRVEDRKFLESQTEEIPDLDIEDGEILSEDLKLAVGRPRMPAEVVYVFVLARGFLGSLSTKESQMFLRESMSLYGFLNQRGLKMPGSSTINDNINAVSEKTREMIFDRQVKWILQEALDDFTNLTIDSTAVKANSSWPNDSKILIGLLMRVNRLGQELKLFNMNNFKPGWVPHWLEEMRKLDFQICLVSGKANAQVMRKKHYRELLRCGTKALAALRAEFNAMEKAVQIETLRPSHRVHLKRIIEQIRSDLSEAARVIEYATDRIFNEKNKPSSEKVLSLSDGSAAFIKKGDREPVIGYKPQLVRSKHGFVTSLLVPEGNAADSIKLVPAILDSIKRTGVVAQLVSTDDGYASKNGRDELRNMGVQIVSISGSKGKQLTTQEDWESETYRDARRYRSAVESLMFTIKDGFSFGQLSRRGIEAVRDELLEKVLAYNFCRSILIKKRRQEAA